MARKFSRMVGGSLVMQGPKCLRNEKFVECTKTPQSEIYYLSIFYQTLVNSVAYYYTP